MVRGRERGMDRGMGRGRAAEERQRTGYGGGEREGWEGEELQKRGREQGMVRGEGERDG